MSLLNSFRVFLLASWLGAAVFFSAVVAPTAFHVLRAFQLPNASEIAGAIVTRALAVINLSGFIISVTLLLTALAVKRGLRTSSLLFELLSISVVAIGTAVGQWVIAARMRGLKAAMTMPIDQMPQADPVRVAFSSLHGYSIGALAVAMAAAALSIFLMFNHKRT